MARSTRGNNRPAPLDPSYKENPAYQQKMQGLMNALLPEGFRKLDVSFPPYWKAEVASGFRAIFLKREDPKLVWKDNQWVPNEGPGQFSRFLWKNTGPALDCRRGSVDDGEIETVESGRIFSTSVLGGLKAIEKYESRELAVICTGRRTLPGNEESSFVTRDFWEFDTFASEETIALIESIDVAVMKRLTEARREANILAEAEMMRIAALGRNNIGVPVAAH